jgi:hypothetical protein
MSVASHAGQLHLAPSFAWIGSEPALVALSVATLLEIAGYYIPWVDHMLDTVATPAAVVAGTVATASMVGDVSPFFRWTLAAIAGGGIAGVIQAGSVLIRGVSTAGTGGLANPLVATMELGGAIITSLLALVLPVLTVMIVLVGLFFLVRRVSQIRWRRSLPQPDCHPAV